MAKVYEFDGVRPVVHPSAYVHPSAVLIGDVLVGPRCYIGPTACLRGDFNRLILEEGVNFQDGCVMHGFPGGDTIVESYGHIGHGAILHGCRIGRNAMVGMSAIVMDNAVVGDEALVAAMAFVKKGQVVPPRALVAGVPAQVVRYLGDDEVRRKTLGTEAYQHLAAASLRTMREVESLAEPEPGRRPPAFSLESHARLGGGARGPSQAA